MYLSELKSRGFQGVDVDLGISLYEYGLCWKEFKRENSSRGIRKGEHLFYYAAGGYGEFGIAYLHPDDFLCDFDWADLEAVAGHSESTKEEWMEMPFVWRVLDLMQYYGTENVFGTTHYALEITSNQYTSKERSKVVHRNGFPHPRKGE